MEQDIRERDETIKVSNEQREQLEEELNNINLQLSQLESTKLNLSEETTTKNKQLQENQKQIEQFREKFIQK